MTGHIAAATSKLDHGAVVELFDLDLSMFGDGIYRFCNQVNEKGNGVVWQGHTYTTLPIVASGFNQRSSGPFPRPRLQVSNTRGTVGAFIRSYNNLRGAKITRKRTLATYLDAANFFAGNALADPLAAYNDEIWTVDRTVQRNKLVVVWELANPIDVAGVMMPGRVVRAQHCGFLYRGSDGCGYSGPPVAKGDDTPTSLLSEDRCSHRPSGCIKRFGTGTIPGSFFPGAGIDREA